VMEQTDKNRGWAEWTIVVDVALDGNLAQKHTANIQRTSPCKLSRFVSRFLLAKSISLLEMEHK